jgi:hypothetical protein
VVHAGVVTNFVSQNLKLPKKKKLYYKYNSIPIKSLSIALQLMCFDSQMVAVGQGGNGELLELRLLESGFLSRFQLNP